MRAWEQRQLIRDWQAIDQWLAAVVVSSCLMHARSQRRETRRLESRAAGLSESWEPHEVIVARDEALTALGQLPEHLRPVVALRYIQAMSGNEVAQFLGLSAKEVSQRLQRGLEIMREYLFDHREGAGIEDDERGNVPSPHTESSRT